MRLSRVLLLITGRQSVPASDLANALHVGAERALKVLEIDGSDSRVLFPIRRPEQGANEYSEVLEDGFGIG